MDPRVDYLSSIVQGILAFDLGSRGDIALVDRRNLDAVLKEKELTLSAIGQDADSAAAAGRLVGADWLLSGEYVFIGSDVLITLSLTDTATAKRVVFRDRGSSENLVHKPRRADRAQADRQASDLRRPRPHPLPRLAARRDPGQHRPLLAHHQGRGLPRRAVRRLHDGRRDGTADPRQAEPRPAPGPRPPDFRLRRRQAARGELPRLGRRRRRRAGQARDPPRRARGSSTSSWMGSSSWVGIGARARRGVEARRPAAPSSPSRRRSPSRTGRAPTRR